MNLGVGVEKGLHETDETWMIWKELERGDFSSGLADVPARDGLDVERELVTAANGLTYGRIDVDLLSPVNDGVLFVELGELVENRS